MTREIGWIRRSGALRKRLGTVLAAGLAVAAVSTPHGAGAELVSYGISGTITSTSLGVLFPGKTAGQTFQGSFTIDTDATLDLLGNGGTAAFYVGAFDVTVESIVRTSWIFCPRTASMSIPG